MLVVWADVHVMNQPIRLKADFLLDAFSALCHIDEIHIVIFVLDSSSASYDGSLVIEHWLAADNKLRLQPGFLKSRGLRILTKKILSVPLFSRQQLHSSDVSFFLTTLTLVSLKLCFCRRFLHRDLASVLSTDAARRSRALHI